MVAGHSSIKRIVHRIGEECRSTAEIARLTSWPEALETFMAKVDIQMMNRNGFKEPPAVRNRLVHKHEILMKYFEQRYGRFADEYDFHAPMQASDPALEGKIYVLVAGPRSGSRNRQMVRGIHQAERRWPRGHHHHR